MKKLHYLSLLTLSLLVILNATTLQAGGSTKHVEMPNLAVQLGAPFRDGAILQRQMKVPVWGWSKPGTKVTVSFAGQTKEATAGKDGKWMLELDPLKASFESREMVVTEEGGKSVTIKNILVGEVWMASGQSNMQWTATKSSCNKLEINPVGEKKINPIREFEIRSVFTALHPVEKANGYWKDGGYNDYSAIALAFAHKLYEELKVPIGILNCSWSQTAIQAWVPREGFRDGKDEYTQKIYKKILQTDPNTKEHKEAWDKFYAEIKIAADQSREITAKTPGNLSGNRDATWLFNGRLNPVIPYAIRGAIWNQGYANMGEGLPYYSNLHSLIRGWRMKWNRPELPVYFHQFYTPGATTKPSIGSTSEMRLGTWLARDIPNANMASQIDIGGAIHYFNKAVPGQRLALHALKNQYGKDVVADGPMFKSYKVDGDKIIVEFDHADGGLVVADTEYNRKSKNEDATGFADPKIIPNGEDKVKLFWLAGKDRVWHPATFNIAGSKVIVKSDAVKKPMGISYGSGGIGAQPCLYNKALLPMTPFIYYDNKLVTSKAWPGIDSMDWPDEKLKIAGEIIDPSSVGKLYEWRKLPILSTQFRENAVLQAGQPITFWGSTQKYGESGGFPEGKAVIHFEFGDIKKTIPVTEGMSEWEVTIPPQEATTEPRTIKASMTIDGELAHERICPGVIFGDVWYVAAPSIFSETKKKKKKKGEVEKPKPLGVVRMIANQSKRSTHHSPSRYSVCVSRTPKNRFASYWKNASGLAAEIGNAIHAKTNKPVGIIFMQTKGGKHSGDPELKSWIRYDYLEQAPSLKKDYQEIAGQFVGTEYYKKNAMSYIESWKTYWNETIPTLMKTKKNPEGETWGRYPSFGGKIESKATETHNCMAESFEKAALKGVIFLSYPETVKDDKGKFFGEQMSALANCFQERFTGNPVFIYTLPSKTLAPDITAPKGIKGKSVAVEINDWKDIPKVIKAVDENIK